MVAFAATNVDDIIVLSILFARRDQHFGARQIVVGQYVGFAGLILASIAASVGLLALPAEAVGALGFVPIALGLRGLWRARHRGAEDNAATVETDSLSTKSVAAITVANGADNIAIYAPLFATIGTGGLVTTVVVFLTLVAVWVLAGLLIGSRPAVVRAVAWAGSYAIPVVLIALGIFIIAESGLADAVLS